MIDLPPFDALALSFHHSPGVHAVLVGSGLSRSAGIATGWEITLDLVKRLAALRGITDQTDWAKWYQDEYGSEPSYSEILDALASTQAERRAILHSYIEPPENGDARKPTKAHRAIAQLVAASVVRVIITTNFDRLLENALRDVGVEPTVIASDDAISGATPLYHARCTIVKVHGDYLDTRIKNIESELETYSPALNALLDQIFDNFGLLVVGWSGEWDSALRSAIQRAPSRRYPFYWAARGEVGRLSQDLIEQRGGRSIKITDADSFFAKLEQTLDALKQASRPHPQSIELAVALARKYCRDDKYAIEWAEFLHAESEKIRKFVTGPRYPKSTLNTENLNALIRDFLNVSEVLRRAVLICGRWGTDSANKTTISTISGLVLSESAGGGYVALISLRNFAASICSYWLVAGALSEDRYGIISKLARTKVKRSGVDVYLSEVIPFLTYGDLTWKFLPGLERRHTPISDFLFEKFISEAHDIAVNDARAEELFDRTELAVALEFAQTRIEYSRSNAIHFWMPAGRFVWKNGGSLVAGELKRIEGLPPDDAFFKSGMMGGSKEGALPTLQEAYKFLEAASRHYF